MSKTFTKDCTKTLSHFKISDYRELPEEIIKQIYALSVGMIVEGIFLYITFPNDTKNDADTISDIIATLGECGFEEEKC